MNQQFYLGRQPILDLNQSVFAYELLFRSEQSAMAGVDDDLLATTTVIINTISQLGIERVLDGRPGFINVSGELLMSDMLELLPVDTAVLEILEDVQVDERVSTRCRELKSKGFRLAIDDYRYQPGYDAIFDIVDYVKVDLTTTPVERIGALQQQLRPWPHLAFLAEKVEDRDQFEHCREMGFSLFQGYFFARPAVISGRKVNPAQGTLLHLLRQVLSDAEVREMHETLKESPTLSIGLLRLVNSVAMGLRREIGSLPQALVMLGRRQLLRWIQLLLYSHDSTETPSPVMEMAAVRARSMELICTAASNDSPSPGDLSDRAFMTGVLSLADAAVGVGKLELIEQLGLADDVRQALLGHEGYLGAMLALMACSERDDFAAAAELLEQLGISADAFIAAHVEAMQWAAALGKPAAPPHE